MKKLLSLILTISSFTAYGQYGSAVITPQNVYEAYNFYIPHDYFMSSALLDTALAFTVENSVLKITNIANDGYTGHKIEIWLQPDLKITNVTYDQWSDVLNGSKDEFTVENIILELNDNPFRTHYVTGHYSMVIKDKYYAGKLLKSEGLVNDTIFQFVFKGKFKGYTPTEIENGKDWILKQNDSKFGLIDSTGVYKIPDSIATFKLGENKLKSIIDQISFTKDDLSNIPNSFIVVALIINEFGKVDTNQMRILNLETEDKLLATIKKYNELLDNWNPAKHNGKVVKSEYIIRINLKK